MKLIFLIFLDGLGYYDDGEEHVGVEEDTNEGLYSEYIHFM